MKSKREILFRVYDLQAKCYVDIQVGKFRADYTFSDVIEDLHNDKISNFVFQEYTGLTDKNGNEIWEGDIVSRCDGPKGEVYYGSGAFHVKGVDCLWFGAKNGVCEDYEVIGNSFEVFSKPS